MRLSIVVPTRNVARYLPAALASIEAQVGAPAVEVVAVDGASTDGTCDLLGEWARRWNGAPRLTLHRLPAPADGLYDALGRGFARATGDVLAWLGADDVYLPGALAAVGRVFAALPRVRWLKGITDYLDPSGTLVETGRCLCYDRRWIAAGVYGRQGPFIQQDSCFWRRDLWRASGGLRRDLRLAGDFELWTRFARHAPLYSLRAHLSAFRRRPGQLSADLAAYRRECDRAAGPPTAFHARVGRYFRLERRLPEALRPILFRLWWGRPTFHRIHLDPVTGAPRATRPRYYVA